MYFNTADDISLKFHGFHPSGFTREYLSTLMQDLQDEAPYGATLDASFSRNNKIFKGIIVIHSRAGKFFASASDSNLKEASRKLVTQLRKRLEKWKSSRFLNKQVWHNAGQDKENVNEQQMF